MWQQLFRLRKQRKSQVLLRLIPAACVSFECLASRQGMVWNGMERKFRHGIWKMPEWNGITKNLWKRLAANYLSTI